MKTLKIVIALSFLAATVGIITNENQNICNLNADVQPLDYCFKTQLVIQNNSGSDVTNKWILVDINALDLTNSGYVDNRFWDFAPIQGALDNDVDYVPTNKTANDAPFWFYLDSLNNNQSKLLSIYHGSNKIRSDHGIFFNGANNGAIASNSELDFGGESDAIWDLVFTNKSSTARNQIILGKFDGVDDGYQIEYYDNGGTLSIRLLLDQDICASTTPVETGRQNWRFEFNAGVGNDVFIYKDDVLDTSCNTGQGVIDTNSDPLVFSNELNQTILQRVILSNSSDGVVLHYDFDSLTTTLENNPNYNILITDKSNFNNDMVFNIIEDQSGFVYALGLPELVSLNNFPQIDDQGNFIVPNTIFDPSFLTPQPTVSTGFLKLNVLDQLDSVSAIGQINPDGPKVAISLAIGLIFASIGFAITRMPPVAVVLFAMPICVTAASGWHSPFWALLIIVAAPIIWFGTSRLQNVSAG